LMSMVVRHLAVFTKEVCLELRYTSRASKAYKILITWKICENSSVKENAPQIVRVAGKRRTQAKLQNVKIPFIK
jgi:hypothetical protein